jgi:hypothetical protein
VANPVQAALEAFKGGKDPEAAVYGTTGSVKPSPVEELAPVEASATSDTSSSEEHESPEEAQAQALPDEEEILVTDDAGKRKVKVSYKDRERIKKAYEAAAGMRKFQAERDKAIKKAAELEKIAPEYQDLKKSWGAVEEAFKTSGVAGLVNLLAGKENAYDTYIQSEVEKRNRRATASPDELRQMDMEEALNTERKARARLEKQVEEQLNSAKTEREIASQKAAESVLHPTFNKYRFSGQLGDEVLEERLDSAIWEQAKAELGRHKEDEISAADVDRVFREVASSFRKVIKTEANKQTKQAIATKKANATEAAAAAATRGTAASTGRDTVMKDMASGKLGNSLLAALSGKLRF